MWSVKRLERRAGCWGCRLSARNERDLSRDKDGDLGRSTEEEVSENLTERA